MFAYSFSLTNLFDLIAPPLCVACQQEGSWLCSEHNTALRNQRPLIDPIRIDGIDAVICRASYDVPAMAALIQRVKYDYWRGAGAILPSVMAPVVPLLPTNAVLVPVPLHWRRRLNRGFNQSELLANALASVSELRQQSVLARKKYTIAQAQLSGSLRQENVRGAFCMPRASEAVLSSAILVDDVITTGATLRECALALRQAGIQKISAVALAKG